jgi:SAM-dependent methyltransferase
MTAQQAIATAAFSSSSYWEARYRHGGTSGAGSYGRLAQYKAAFLNSFIRQNHIASVVDFGCGDGNQLSLLDMPSYTGIDVSPSSLARCSARFQERPSYRFVPESEAADVVPHELAMSIDVIFHLVEDHVFDAYLARLFAKATRFVVVYSSNIDLGWPSMHVRHRRFTDAVMQRYPGWRLAAHVPNLVPFGKDEPDQTSFADFFVYATPGEDCVLPIPG